jgi:ubiquitin carboxyl-terminal hydrolase 14
MSALKDNIGDTLFGIETESVYTNAESDAEPAYTGREAVRTLSCNITEKTAHLYNAIEVSLEETIEKQSAVLGRTAQYTKKSKLARLPPYLPVQFVRFAWRKDTNKRAKILRPVSFPEVLDVRNLCTDKLRASIAAHTDLLELARDAELAEGKAKQEQEAKGTAPAAVNLATSDPSPHLIWIPRHIGFLTGLLLPPHP